MGGEKGKKQKPKISWKNLFFLRQLLQMEYLGLEEASLGVTLERLLIDVTKSRILL